MDTIATDTKFSAEKEPIPYVQKVDAQKIAPAAYVRVEFAQLTQPAASQAKQPRGDVASLIAQLKSADPKIRASTYEKLGALGPSAKGAVDIIKLDGLNDSDYVVSLKAAGALPAIVGSAEAAKFYGGLLREKSSSQKILQLACRGLAHSGKEGLVPLRDYGLTNADPKVRRTAINCLAVIQHEGADISSAKANITKLLGDKDKFTVDKARECLAAMERK